MAGLGRKVFNAGEVLSAANVQGYLQDQVVQVYSGTAARSSALGTAVSEGMMSYLTDANELSVYTANGTAAWSAVNLAQSPNAVINGAFEINQRSFTSTTTSGVFMYDRFAPSIAGDGTSTFTAQTLSPADLNVSGFGDALNTLRVVTTGQTSTTVRTSFSQSVENVRTLSGQTVTLSFWAKASSGTPKIYAEVSQVFGSGGSSSVTGNGSQVTLSTSWARYSVAIALASISGKTIGTNSYISPTIWLSAGSDFNSRTGSLGIQSNTFDIWGVQLEAGSVATPFRRSSPTLQGELAACQRYYQRFGGYLSSGNQGLGGGVVNTSTRINSVTIRTPVTLRTAPTVSVGGTITGYDGSNATALSSFAVTQSGIDGCFIDMNFSGASFTVGRAGMIFAAAGATNYIEFSSEL